MTGRTGQSEELRRIFECLSPLLGITLGFVIGVVLSMFLPSGAWWGFWGKLLMACYGFIGWAIGACFVQRKRLYCGATEPINPEDWPRYSHRYGFGLLIVFGGFIMATIGLLGAGKPENRLLGFTVFYCCLPTTFAVLVGEIGWEDPLRFFRKHK